MHFPARRSKRDPIRRTGILPAVAILMTVSCHKCDKDRVARIQVIPDIVAAIPGKPFLMSVRLWNGRGELMPHETAEQVRWTSGPHLTKSPLGGAQTTATVLASATSPITLTATVSDVSGSATIALAKPGVSLVMDWATARHVNGERPSLVLVDGQTYPEWRSDSVVAFAGGGPLDDFRRSDDQGEVTVFSPGHALQRMKVDWTDNCDHVRMTEDGSAYPTEVVVPCNPTEISLTKSTAIRVRILTLVATDNPQPVVDINLSDARRVLENGWTGLILNLESPNVDEFREQPIILDIREELGWTCPMIGELSVPGQLASAGVDLTTLGPDKVTVVYAQQLQRLLESGLLVAARGYACQWEASVGTIVLISWERQAGTTLAHELGHAIGAPLEHTNGLVGLDYWNLMWSFHKPVPASRDILTLGQAFRLSLDGDAFIHQRTVPHPEPKCAGQNEGNDSPCPRVAKDVTRQ